VKVRLHEQLHTVAVVHLKQLVAQAHQQRYENVADQVELPVVSGEHGVPEDEALREL